MGRVMATQRSLFDLATDPKLTDGLREILTLPRHGEALQSTPDTSTIEGFPGDLKVPGRRNDAASLGDASHAIFCSACRCPLLSREEQMEHYKLDWHRFNLKQRLAGRSPFTVDEFEKKSGDLSSISGSDSEDDEVDSPEGDVVTHDETDSCRLSSKVLLQNSEGQYLSLYRWAIQSTRVEGEVGLVESLLKVSNKTVWVILMAGGGHFAGAVFQGKEILQHKTFHRYTVRAKRGTAQGLRDGQNRGHAPKSAGAALRRHNEAALVKDIQDLLKIWTDFLKMASVIFLRAPKYNRSVFCGGRGAPLEKKDMRIHSLPFATRRATFSEIKRVHEALSTIQVYGKNADISSIFSPSKRVWQKEKTNHSTEMHPSSAVISQVDDDEDEEEEGSEDEGSVQLEMVQVTLGTLDLREHEVQPGNKKRRKRRERKMRTREVSDPRGPVEHIRPPRPQKTPAETAEHEPDEVCKQWEYSLRDALFTACKTGDTDTLCTLLQPSETEGTRTLQLLNTPIDSLGFTLLHVAAAAGQKAVVRVLLDAGSDPACRDRKGQTPYAVSPDKDTRNTFRKYMAEQPDKYNYTKAQVPGPLTAEIESKKAEKKKTQKAAKKKREREQKEEKISQQQEQEEKTRFLQLSDTEKRALMSQSTASAGAPHTRRCWQCGESLLGKVPFKYLNFSFCTPSCVQAHRRANAATRQ